MSGYYLYFILLISAVVITLIIAFFAWKHKNINGAKSFAFLMMASTCFALSTVFSGFCDTAEMADFWMTNVRFVFVVCIPVFFLIFVLEYEGRYRLLNKKNILLLFLLPIITVLLTWTNHYHNLFIQDINYGQIDNFTLRLSWETGPWFLIHTIYSYILLFISIFLLFIRISNTSYPYNRQAFLLLIGTLIPVASNLIVLLKLYSGPVLDFTALGFTGTGIVFAWSLFRFKLLVIMPVARSTIIENMMDIVIVVDVQNNIIDVNPAIQSIVKDKHSNIIGTSAKNVLPFLDEKLSQKQKITDKIEQE